jgi:hypothetical protein
MRYFKNLSIILPLLVLTSCGSLERSFVDQMDRESDGLIVPGKDFPVMAGDSGEAYRSKEEIQQRTPASARSQSRSKNIASIRQELAGKEEALHTEEEVDQYRRDQRFLPTDSDKLYYLSLQGEERTRYINTKKEDIQEDKNGKQDLVGKHSVHGSALYLGMEKEQVEKMWGRPSKIDIAGNPRLQNERWSFVEDGNVKQVYFESGKVQGWALDL